MQFHIDLHDELKTLEANRDSFRTQAEMQLLRFDGAIAQLRDVLNRNQVIEQAQQAIEGTPIEESDLRLDGADSETEL